MLDDNYSGNGLTGTSQSIVDLHSGAFLEAEQADIVAETHGYDGNPPGCATPPVPTQRKKAATALR